MSSARGLSAAADRVRYRVGPHRSAALLSRSRLSWSTFCMSAACSSSARAPRRERAAAPRFVRRRRITAGSRAGLRCRARHAAPPCARSALPWCASVWCSVYAPPQQRPHQQTDYDSRKWHGHGCVERGQQGLASPHVWPRKPPGSRPALTFSKHASARASEQASRGPPPVRRGGRRAAPARWPPARRAARRPGRSAGA